MITLSDTIKQKKPIKVYIRVDNEPFEYYDTMEYNGDIMAYQGQFGKIDLKDIPLILTKKIDHIKLESLDKEV